jgi:hypothetical protein
VGTAIAAVCGFRVLAARTGRKGMSKIRSKVWSWLVLSALVLFALSSNAFAQKIKVGYDKSVDFSRYKTYTWAEPAMPPTRPMLYSTVLASVDDDLKS